MEEVEQYFPSFRTFIDATEQEIPRPKNKRRRLLLGKEVYCEDPVHGE